MTILRKASGFISITVLAFSASMIYRPYVYTNNIYDFHLADSLPSFFSVIAIYSMFDLYYTFIKKKFDRAIVLSGIIFAMLIYESVQLFGGGFDIYDIIAIALGALTVFMTIRLSPK